LLFSTGLLHGATIQTDKKNYAVGETMVITGTGYTANMAVEITVTRPDKKKESVLGVVADANGAFTAHYVPGEPRMPGDYRIAASDSTRSSTTAVTTAKAGAADLDQCRNGEATSPNLCADIPGSSGWVNGNVGEKQGHYAEGYSIPYRMKFTGVSAGTWTVDIGYDVTQSNKHAIDFLTRYDWMNDPLHPVVFGHNAECVDPPDAFLPAFGGTAGVCDPTLPPPSVFPVPAPNIPFSLGGGAPPCTSGLPVGNVLASATSCPGTTWTAISGSGNAYFSMWGGTITNVYYRYQAIGGQNNKETRIRVVFTVPENTTGSVVLAWGGHIAREQDWGTLNSASGISGSPYHMRLKGFCSGETDPSVDCDAGGAQDRSLSAAVVYNPPKLTLRKVVVNDDGGTASATDWTLTATGPVTISGVHGDPAITGAVVQPGTYSLSESPGPSGYSASQWSCVKGSASPVTGNSITLAAGDNATCTITNNDQAPTLIVIKHVINDNGGTKSAADFLITVTGISPNPASFSGAVSPGTTVAIKAGGYEVTENEDPGYDATYSADCSGNIAVGETKTCTITNNDRPARLTLRKEVVNDNGGTASATAWTLSASGPTPISGVHNSSAVTNAAVSAGNYNLSESGGPAGYDASEYSCVKNNGSPVSGNSITLALGDTAVCTITNNDRPSYLVINKVARGGNGAFGFTISGPSPSTPSITTSGSPNGAGTTGAIEVSAGNYTISETSLPPMWVLTASTCEVNNAQFGTPTQVNGVNVSWALTIPLGTTVTCTFDNSLQGSATRTQGFWATHTGLANTVWASVLAADASLCSTPITAVAAPGANQLMGGFWANISQKTSGDPRRREDIDQARMQMLQQYLAAVLNVYQFGTPGVNLAAARTAYCGNDVNAIRAQTSILGAYNESGDSVAFTPGVAASPQLSRLQANLSWWDVTIH
jgi:hypothetical protein